MQNLNPIQFSEDVDVFIWNFKVGDNIKYNYSILTSLYEAREKSGLKKTFNKPLIIQLISIIECVMYDLAVRLHQATNQFPTSIIQTDRLSIKGKLSKDRSQIRDIPIERIKNYSMTQLVRFFEKYRLFGDPASGIYTRLTSATLLRNRVHIFNWYSNLEVNEKDAYSDSRLAEAEFLFNEILSLMILLYRRP